MEEKDLYKTIDEPSEEVLFKDRGSKFYGIAFPATTEEEIKKYLNDLQEKHRKAGHFCYAWRLGKNHEHHRTNDDGEPANTAGMPIFGQLKSFEVTNILVVVLRYFGGTKLGVGGLINAYRTTAKMALEASLIKSKTIDVDFEIKYDYPNMNKVMRIVKEQNLTVKKQVMELDCTLYLSIRQKEAHKIFEIFDAVYGVSIQKKD